MKLLREPLLHFLFIGAAIYIFYAVFAPPEPERDDAKIVVSAGEIQWMQTSWKQRWNRPPTAREMAGLVEHYVRETVLYREALAMGLDQNDQVIRRRLAQKVEYLAKDLVALTPASEEDLQAYFAEHRERYQEPTRYTFTQVYIDPDKRGDATLPDAEKIKGKLIEQGDAIEDPGALGDGFMLQNYYPDRDSTDIQTTFGAGFKDSLIALSPGEWHGPISSGYGVHLVYVSHVSKPGPPKLADVRERVIEDWKTDRSEELNEEFYINLRDSYEVVVEWPTGEEASANARGQGQ